MKRSLLGTPLALGLLACGPDAGFEVAAGPEVVTPIINGEPCDTEAMDTAVALLIDADIEISFLGAQSIRTVGCTGTLIAPDVVMTAAHCVDPETLAATATFGFGEVTRLELSVTREPDLVYLASQQQQQGAPPSFPEDAIAAVKAIPHPDFDVRALTADQLDGLANYNDVGLLFLERPIEGVVPAVVITAEEAAQVTEGAEVEIAGWGLQAVLQSQFEAPPAGSVGRKVCATSFINELGTMEMQIGSGLETSRKCQGDSGGPTYLEVETPHSRTRRLIGITSRAYDASNCQKGGVDVRVDAWLDWFDGHMRDGCEDGTRVWCEVPGLIPPSYYDLPRVPGDKDGDGAPGDEGDEAGEGASGCQCGESEGGDPAIALLGLGLLVIPRRRALLGRR